ncbi:EthD family reductase [Frondihabitans australicus]|uniref:EthD family reductase n=1 Tax=Frondihabitans australicus TaxID=386892 RepID=A0A495IIU5_9MICO|nr:EthD family reductase [Frondihabitans australicus]RKR75045.1 hypothetical protein C8E83_2180 [Frondihabitans australicus]
MPTKITFVIDNPDDPAAFETVYASMLDSAAKLPGLRRTESAKVWPKEDGSPTPAYRTLDLYFDGYDEASAAVATDAAQALFGAIIGSGVSFRPLFSDIESV